MSAFSGGFSWHTPATRALNFFHADMYVCVCVCVCVCASEMKQIGFKNGCVIQMRNDGPGSECLASYSQVFIIIIAEKAFYPLYFI